VLPAAVALVVSVAAPGRSVVEPASRSVPVALVPVAADAVA